MKRYIILFVGFIVFIVFISLVGNIVYSKLQKEKVFRECSKLEKIENFRIGLNGFKFDEIKTIHVKEFKGQTLHDSFLIYTLIKDYDTIKKNGSFDLSKPLNINSSYEFIINNQLFTLSNMQFCVVDRRNMFNSKIYFCELGIYKLGKQFYHGSCPIITKDSTDYMRYIDTINSIQIYN